MNEESMDSRPSTTTEQVTTPELRSRCLSEPETREAVDALPGFFREVLPDAILVASYGTGCFLHHDLLFQPMRVGVAWLDRFLAESIEQRIFVPGHSEMTISAPENCLSILFCHEADIHVSGTDAGLLRRFISTAPYAGLQIRSAGVPN